MNRSQHSPRLSPYGGDVVRGSKRHRNVAGSWWAWDFDREHSPYYPHHTYELGEQSVDVVRYSTSFDFNRRTFCANPRMPAIPLSHMSGKSKFAQIIARAMPEAWCMHKLSTNSPAVLRGDSLEEKFVRLANEWREETDGLSSPTRMTCNQAYLGIIALGQPVVSLILKELRDRGGFWYPALGALTDANPIPASATGRPQLMKKAWLEWGRKYELIA